MGITITSPKYSIDMGYFGFYRLRQEIANLLGADVGEHYEIIAKTQNFSSKEEEQKYWEAYDQKICDLAMKYHQYSKIFNFLYESDCDGYITYGTCKQILKLVESTGYSEDKIFGYAGRPDAAKFSDFLRLLEDCAKNKKKLRWC